jgi:type VI secretion system protein ImpH
VRQYLNFELDWDLRLVLTRAQVPQTRLGVYGRLGWTTWLGKRAPRTADVDDLRLNPEELLHTRRAARLDSGASRQPRDAVQYTSASAGASF